MVGKQMYKDSRLSNGKLYRMDISDSINEEKSKLMLSLTCKVIL